MRALMIFLRATLTGGILFLLPLVVLAIVLGKALQISRRVVVPLAGRIPWQTVGGVRVAEVVAIAALVLFCFLAGLLARTRLARRTESWLERALLSHVPGYNFLKGIGESLLGLEAEHAYQVVLARIEDSWQIGFLMERLESGHYAVFVPGAPSVWSGSVYLMTEDRFRLLDISRAEAVKCLRQLGVGADRLMGRKMGAVLQKEPWV
jgi:uncharacterized membrane protein